MRKIWKSALVAATLVVSLTAGIAGGSTVKPRNVGVQTGPTVLLAVVTNYVSGIQGIGYASGTFADTTITLQWFPVESTKENPVVGYEIRQGLNPCPEVLINIAFCGLKVLSSATSASFIVHGFSGHGGISWDGWTGNGYLTAEFADGTSATTPFSTPSGAYVLLPTGVTYRIPTNGSLVVSWDKPAQGSVTLGSADVSVVGHVVTVGGQVCNAGFEQTCTFTKLDPNKPLNANVCTKTNVGMLASCVSSSSIWAKSALRLSTIVPLVLARGKSTAAVIGGTPNAVLTTSVDGARQINPVLDGLGQPEVIHLNTLGQSQVTFDLLTYGKHVLTADAGGQKASSVVWVPSVSVPKSITHGRSFSVVISQAPSKVDVIITTNDGRTMKTKTSGSGGVSVPVRTTKSASLKVNVSVAGTAFGPYSVLVS